jgi:hypothetical protein
VVALTQEERRCASNSIKRSTRRRPPPVRPRAGGSRQAGRATARRGECQIADLRDRIRKLEAI